MIRKKTLSAPFVVVLAAFLLAGCGGQPEVPSGPQTTSIASSTPAQSSVTSQATTQQDTQTDTQDDTQTDTQADTQDDTQTDTQQDTQDDTQDDTQTDSTPVSSDYHVSVGGTNYDLVASAFDKEVNPDQTGEYSVTVSSVKADDAIVFSYLTDTINTNIGSDPEDAQNKNNVVATYDDQNVGTFKIHNDAENVGIYFKTWESGGYSFWIKGYVAGSNGEDNQGVTYTITGLPDWITNDGCVIFGWVWGSSTPGQSSDQWVSCEYGALNDEGKPAQVSFDVDEEMDGCVLVRCVAGTTTPDWAVNTNDAGRIYNQTADITFTTGVYSYAGGDWKEYNPSSN